MSNAPISDTKEPFANSSATRDETLAYLSRYLFWLVMAVLMAVFSLML